MTRRERIQAIVRGEPTDRPAISFWHHFPQRDETATGLADATVAFQGEYDVDLVKLMPTGMYPAIDYGTRVSASNDQIGTTRFVDGPIKQRGDWKRLRNTPPDRGVLAREVEVVKLVRAALGPDIPVIQTIFSPLTIAAKVAGSANMVARAAEQDEDELRGALTLFAADVVSFGRACLKAGADGFFFATQLAGRSTLPDGLYRNLGVPYDLEVLNALRDSAWCMIMHLHGNDPMFELADEYPIDAVNWHDRETQPRLADAKRMTKRALVAGISRFGAIANGGSKEIAAEVSDAALQTCGRRLIIAPGCVVPCRIPPENLRAARRAVDAIGT